LFTSPAALTGQARLVTSRPHGSRGPWNEPTSEKSIHIKVKDNPYAKTTSIINEPRIIRSEFMILTNSWSKFGLSYPNFKYLK